MTSDLTIEQASDLAGESATTFAIMMAGDGSIDEMLAWFDEVYEQIMQRLIRKALAKRPRRVVIAKNLAKVASDSPLKREQGA